MLYSDIDPAFYSRFGFEEFGNANFVINVPEDSSGATPERSGEELLCRPLLMEDVPLVLQQYNRWLRRSPTDIIVLNHTLNSNLRGNSFCTGTRHCPGRGWS